MKMRKRPRLTAPAPPPPPLGDVLVTINTMGGNPEFVGRVDPDTQMMTLLQNIHREAPIKKKLVHGVNILDETQTVRDITQGDTLTLNVIFTTLCSIAICWREGRHFQCRVKGKTEVVDETGLKGGDCTIPSLPSFDRRQLQRDLWHVLSNLRAVMIGAAREFVPPTAVLTEVVIFSSHGATIQAICEEEEDYIALAVFKRNGEYHELMRPFLTRHGWLENEANFFAVTFNFEEDTFLTGSLELFQEDSIALSEFACIQAAVCFLHVLKDVASQQKYKLEYKASAGDEDEFVEGSEKINVVFS